MAIQVGRIGGEGLALTNAGTGRIVVTASTGATTAIRPTGFVRAVRAAVIGHRCASATGREALRAGGTTGGTFGPARIGDTVEAGLVPTIGFSGITFGAVKAETSVDDDAVGEIHQVAGEDR